MRATVNEAIASWVMLAIVLLFAVPAATAIQSCAAVAPIAKSALHAVAPILADALTDEIKRKFGPDAEPDPATARCVRDDGSTVEDYPEDFADRGWVHCWVDRVP